MSRRLHVKLFAMLLIGSLASCGYTSRDSEMVGQVKNVMHNTPLFCPNYDDVDISLGVMRDGVGSMSAQDLWLTVDDKAHYDALKRAAESGTLVRIRYDQYRVRLCTHELIVRGVEVLPK